MKTCLIVDDHPIVRIGLARVLAGCLPDWACLEAGTLAEARRLLEQHAVGLVLLDLRLGGEQGADLLPWACRHYPETPVLVMSMHDEAALVEQVLAAGARGYLLKDMAAVMLEQAVDAVLAGRRHVPEVLAQKLFFRRLEGQGMDSLTPRECQVFQLLADGLSKTVMAERLGLSPNTVETYRQRLRVKLGACDNLQLVRMAVQHYRSQPGF
ncbi:response regulator transcription factor [Chromobacterium paludis]|uniref:Response regulator transcription factor n=1 Tax=Chromobacterium paludis TaxID=2605945 RepID=A0A5C1DJR8_9NEIS|nr:response regulator transcription factor [Chromobacterium paludis]QEL56297.1 response regulator transcription factor [Chromobacterium paludis]